MTAVQVFAANTKFSRDSLLLEDGPLQNRGWLLEQLDCMATSERRALLDAVCHHKYCKLGALLLLWLPLWLLVLTSTGPGRVAPARARTLY